MKCHRRLAELADLKNRDHAIGLFQRGGLPMVWLVMVELLRGECDWRQRTSPQPQGAQGCVADCTLDWPPSEALTELRLTTLVTTYIGRALTSSYTRPTYSPMIPRKNRRIPERKEIRNTSAVNPLGA